MKLWIFDVISGNDGSKAGRIFDISMSGLIMINVVFIIGDTFQGRPATMVAISRIVEIFSIVVFTVEYGLRLWTADLIRPNMSPARARFRYVVSGMAIIDLLSILPAYIPFIIPVDLRVLRMLRLFRLVRAFKMERYTVAITRIGRVLKDKAPELISSVSVICVLMAISSVVVYYVESPVQPEAFSSVLSGLWLAVVTLTTVGYGDIFPVTMLGKVISAIIALLGIGLIALPTGIISAGFLDELRKDGPLKK
jgi:voltage-gated potassium channel